MNSSSQDTTLEFRSAVYILNSTNVTIESTQFLNGTGVGVSIFDTGGFVTILDSIFSGNAVKTEEQSIYPGGGGIYIEHTYCTPGRTSECDYRHNPYNSDNTYRIHSCSFSDNHASTLDDKHIPEKGTQTLRLGKGGGVSISLKGQSEYNRFTISSCWFANNSALYGGGLDISLQDSAGHNNIIVKDCLLEKNVAAHDGGGARLGWVFYGCECLNGNVIQFLNSIFAENDALWGGGTELFSSRTRNAALVTNAVNFTNCSWVGNSAKIGAALDLSPEAWSSLTDGYLPIPVFDTCNFLGNKLVDRDSHYSEVMQPSGILFSNTFTVNFSASVTFRSNNGTAIYTSAGSINVLVNATIHFEGNQGIQGGAIALIGYSALRTFPDSKLFFINNTATDRGGGIFALSIDETDFIYSCNCFIRYYNSTESPHNWKSYFYFENNIAKSYGHSIYATSLLPCARAATTNVSESIDISHVFRWPWAPFNYSDPDKDYNIASDPATVNLNISASEIEFSPGEVYNLHPYAEDDLGNVIQSVYKASTSNESNPVQIESTFVYVSDGNILITGPVNSTFQLNFETIGFRRNGTSVTVTLADCPPGYVIQGNSECVCSARTDERYAGISQCDNGHFRGLLNKGFWAGCSEDGVLMTAECPLGYCHDAGSEEAAIPLSKNCKELDEYLCGAKNRTGLLCGQCKGNLSIYYHSQRYLCGECNDDRFGFLYYFLSELVPLTILFVVIIIFNINLTSGLANSFILYAQVLDFFDVTALGTYTLPPVVSALTDIYRFLFGFLNLDFFRLDAASFCLWKGATVLDVLVFKYVTTAYAMVLLVILVICFKYLPCNRCLQFKRDRREQVIQGSVIHGIAAFLIISYAQCAKVSFQILTRVDLRGKRLRPEKQVVFLSGSTQFFSYEHLPYAVPAIFVLCTICTLPPVILMVYPAVNKIVELFRRGEEPREGRHHNDMRNGGRQPCADEPQERDFLISWEQRGVAKYVPYMRSCCRVANLKPLLDSFQGCYKGHFRFFAGLYFVYRLAISAAFAFSTSAIQLYVCLVAVVVIMLTLHAIAQPYEKRYYNIVDAFIFADLTIINGISLYDYYWAQYQSTHESVLKTFSSFQVVLIYLPILYIVIILSLKLACRFSEKVRRKLTSINQYVPLFEESAHIEQLNVYPDVNDFPVRMLDEDRQVGRLNRRHQRGYGSTAYRTF